jgi:hypothetical protein
VFNYCIECVIDSEWTARKRERAAGTLCPAVELPHSSQNRLKWATRPVAPFSTLGTLVAKATESDRVYT